MHRTSEITQEKNPAVLEGKSEISEIVDEQIAQIFENIWNILLNHLQMTDLSLVKYENCFSKLFVRKGFRKNKRRARLRHWIKEISIDYDMSGFGSLFEELSEAVSGFHHALRVVDETAPVKAGKMKKGKGRRGKEDEDDDSWIESDYETEQFNAQYQLLQNQQLARIRKRKEEELAQMYRQMMQRRAVVKAEIWPIFQEMTNVSDSSRESYDDNFYRFFVKKGFCKKRRKKVLFRWITISNPEYNRSQLDELFDVLEVRLRELQPHDREYIQKVFAPHSNYSANKLSKSDRYRNSRHRMCMQQQYFVY